MRERNGHDRASAGRLRPLSARILSSFLIFAASLAFILGTGRTRGPWRIDEAHRIAETHFADLVLQGRFHDQAWFRHIVDRANPPVGKYLFGLAGIVSGAEIPRSLAVRKELPEGDLGQRLAAGDESRYAPLLSACRRVSAVATALTAATIWFAALTMGGFPSAVLVLLFYMSNFLTQTFAGTAIYDPLLTLFVTIPMAVLPFWWDAPPSRIRRIIGICILGLTAALAAETRISGLVSLAAIEIVLMVLLGLRRDVRYLVAAAATATICIATAIAINPFYWSTPEPGADVPAAISVDEALPLRVGHRVRLQIEGLERLSRRETLRHELLTAPWRKIRFAVEATAGDLPGLVTILGAVLALLLALVTPSSRHVLGLSLVWGGAVLTIIALWLPFPWQRYLLVAIPPLALLAGLGWSEAARQLVARLRLTPSDQE